MCNVSLCIVCLRIHGLRMLIRTTTPLSTPIILTLSGQYSVGQWLEKMGRAKVFCFVLLLSLHFCNVELASSPFTQTSVILPPCKEHFAEVSLNNSVLFAVPPDLTGCVNETDGQNASVVSWARGTGCIIIYHGYSLVVEHAEKIN